MAFLETRRSRRRILRIVKEQQALEAECALKLREVTVAGTRKYLTAVAEWLTGLSPERQTSPADKRIFAAVSPAFPLEDWLAAQAAAGKATDELKTASADAAAADAAYSAVAPLGVVSMLFMDQKTKSRAEELKRIFDARARGKAAAELRLRQAQARISDFAEKFLKQAGTPQGVSAFGAEPHLSTISAAGVLLRTRPLPLPSSSGSRRQQRGLPGCATRPRYREFGGD